MLQLEPVTLAAICCCWISDFLIHVANTGRHSRSPAAVGAPRALHSNEHAFLSGVLQPAKLRPLCSGSIDKFGRYFSAKIVSLPKSLGHTRRLVCNRNYECCKLSRLQGVCRCAGAGSRQAHRPCRAPAACWVSAPATGRAPSSTVASHPVCSKVTRALCRCRSVPEYRTLPKS